jgi:NTP pyrophosphatase (non-canonical NTP hydrolase)
MTTPQPVSVSEDMPMIHNQYGTHAAVRRLSKPQLKEFIEFRLNFLQEELNEGFKALAECDAEELVDSMADLVVVAVGTLDLFEVDFDKAWKEVLKANMNKVVGIKPNRPNPLGLPDLLKLPDWQPPSHKDNHGHFAGVFDEV